MYKKIFLFSICFIFWPFFESLAHFGAILPSSSIVENKDNASLKILLAFMHPFELEYMDLDKPTEFGVVVGKQHLILTNQLAPVMISGHKAWNATYKVSIPGDHIFYMKSMPYWEASEDTYIQQYTKVVVNGFGLEDSWDKPIGLKAEIVPITRPYGLWKNNIFCAKVLFEGKPQKDIYVEIEYLNIDHKIKNPSNPFITQVTKTDENGNFCYNMPFAGWWGFAALIEDKNGMEHNGKRAGLEIDAVIWVNTLDIR